MREEQKEIERNRQPIGIQIERKGEREKRKREIVKKETKEQTNRKREKVLQEGKFRKKGVRNRR